MKLPRNTKLQLASSANRTFDPLPFPLTLFLPSPSFPLFPSSFPLFPRAVNTLPVAPVLSVSANQTDSRRQTPMRPRNV